MYPTNCPTLLTVEGVFRSSLQAMLSRYSERKFWMVVPRLFLKKVRT